MLLKVVTVQMREKNEHQMLKLHLQSEPQRIRERKKKTTDTIVHKIFIMKDIHINGCNPEAIEMRVVLGLPIRQHYNGVPL